MAVALFALVAAVVVAGTALPAASRPAAPLVASVAAPVFVAALLAWVVGRPLAVIVTAALVAGELAAALLAVGWARVLRDAPLVVELIAVMLAGPLLNRAVAWRRALGTAAEESQQAPSLATAVMAGLLAPVILLALLSSPAGSQDTGQ